MKNTMKKVKKMLGTAGLALALTSKAIGADANGSVAGYYDTRGMPNANINISAKDLPFNTKFFGFTDFFMDDKDNSKFNNAYGEFKLTKNLGKGIGLSGEYDRDFSKIMGIIRTGLSYTQPIKDGFLELTAFPYATRNDGAQVVLSGKKVFNEGKWYVGGFFDYNVKPNNVVTEIQAGRRIAKDTYFVLEGRHNGFKKDAFGVGIGIERKF